jgi:membrane-associated phospholipid phosphatase
MKKNIAHVVSVLGHPLLTIPLYVVLVMFGSEDFKRASLNTFLIIGCVFIPVTVWLYIKSRNGSYTNFDVSDRKQRKSVFVFIIPILSIVTYILYKSDQASHLWQSMLFGLILLFILQVVNFRIKSSMHVSLNIYLSFLIMTVNYPVGIIVLLLTAPIGWSRVALGRHSLKEVLSGTVIGLLVSLVMMHAEGYL